MHLSYLIGAHIVGDNQVWSHLYSLSFEPNFNWTRQYPGQEEIQDYLIQVAHKYQLYRHIRFSTAVEEAHWDDNSNQWQTTIRRLGGKEVEIGNEYMILSDFLVSAVGQLNVPKHSNLRGLEEFRGKVMHSARWDWDYDFREKKVGIVGSGATAAQIIPEIAASCKNLTVFQRSPVWVMPRHDATIGPAMQLMYRFVPFVRRRYRAALMDSREGFFDASYNAESSKHDFVMDVTKQHLLSQLPGDSNAALREKLSPTYPFGCKRCIVSDDYYPALAQENVTLETMPITGVSPGGVNVKGGIHYDFDLIIEATGFLTTQFMYPIKIYGTKGRSLEEMWAKGAKAHLGITVDNLPNFGMLYGPNTNLTYNSLILPIEAQSKYINALISSVLQAKRQGKSLSIQPKQQVVEDYNKEVQARLANSTFANPNCTSWFKNEAGLITNNWCASAIAYQERTCFVDWTDFDLRGTAAADVYKKGKTKWKRVVEETQISNGAIGLACLTAIGVSLAGYAFYKKA